MVKGLTLPQGVRFETATVARDAGLAARMQQSGAIDGARTRDIQDHNLSPRAGETQLSRAPATITRSCAERL